MSFNRVFKLLADPSTLLIFVVVCLRKKQLQIDRSLQIYKIKEKRVLFIKNNLLHLIVPWFEHMLHVQHGNKLPKGKNLNLNFKLKMIMITIRI